VLKRGPQVEAGLVVAASAFCSNLGQMAPSERAALERAAARWEAAFVALGQGFGRTAELPELRLRQGGLPP
jgi:hypothetical protein